jgi:hypothetical protein
LFDFVDKFLVGVRGFEPLTPCSRSRCATRLRYTPMVGNALSHRDFGRASAIPRRQQIRTKRTRRGICTGQVSQRLQLFSQLRLLHRSQYALSVELRNPAQVGHPF